MTTNKIIKLKKNLQGWFYLFAIASSLAVVSSFSQAQITDPVTSSQNNYFAKVDGIVISVEAYFYALRAEAKQKYYHGKINQERFDELQKEVSERLIDQALLLSEADRLNIRTNNKKIEQDLVRFETRYSEDPSWKQHGQSLLKNLQTQLETKYRIEELNQQTKNSVFITEGQTKNFYNNNLDLFKTPEKRRLSLILIKVPPHASSEKWQETEKALQSLRQRVLAGEDFAELARSYSEDETAEQGGDMGLQHRGMLHEDVEKVVDNLELGEISEPTRLLVGYVVVRLEEVKPEEQNGFDASKKRAEELLRRQLEQQTQDRLIKRLREEANIVRNEEYLNLKLE